MAAEELKDGDRAGYQRLEQTDDKAQRVIAQLEKIKITDISFEKLTANEAMDYLTKKVVGEKGGGVINFVIRGDDQAKQVGITSKSQTFAQAVDEICRQSGRMWMIDFNEASGAPVLVIKKKNGQQDAPSNGG
jgi:capsular polysaccharide biosynthesis protein